MKTSRTLLLVAAALAWFSEPVLAGSEPTTPSTAAAPPAPGWQALLRPGDLIFHQSRSSQSEAIRLATGSRYTHMGLIVEQEGGRLMVLEAIEPVSLTPVDRWVARGVEGHAVVKRLHDADGVFTDEVLARVGAEGHKLLGQHYDLYFGWSDDRIYCSELVYKAWKRGAGVEVGELARLGDFDLGHPAVKAKLAERYGGKVPLDEVVISPQAMFESARLVTVVSVP